MKAGQTHPLTQFLVAVEMAVMRLLWSGPHTKEEVVPSTSLFSSNQQPVLKLSRLPADQTDILYLYPGVQPFRDQHDLWLADVPPDLEGSKLVSMYSATQREGGPLTFEVNVPSKLFVSHEKGADIPIENCGDRQVKFRVRDDGITILKAPNNRARAQSASYHVIEEARLIAPGVYKFTMQKTNRYWTIFLQALAKSDEICSGEIVVLSDPTTKDFGRCVASSTLSDEFKCEFGLNLRHRDVPYGVWKSAGGLGPGQYVEIYFNERVRLTQFKFKPLDDPLTWPSELELHFVPSGSTTIPSQKFTLLYSTNLDLLMYDLAPVITDYVKVEVSQMYANGQATGGSFEMIGSHCESDKIAANPFFLADQLVPSFAISACNTTMGQIDDFPAIHEGLVVDLACPKDCQYSIDTSLPQPVFGTNVYAPDSALCIAAVHTGICFQQGSGSIDVSAGECLLTMRLLPGQAIYQGSSRNTVHSQPHGPHEISFVLQPRTTEKLPESSKLAGENKGGDTYIIAMHAVSPSMPALPPGMAVDDGAVFGPRDEFKYPAFGWSRQAKVTHCADLSGTNATPVQPALLKVRNEDAMTLWTTTGGISFPPPSTSEACTDGQEDCSPNSWSMDLPSNSLVNLVLQLGNPCLPGDGSKISCPCNTESPAETNRYDLSVNGETAAENMQLSKGDFYFLTKNNIRIPANGKLTLTSHCEAPSDRATACANALTTVMAITVSLPAP
eukprot:Gregarina_sp_Poly_1__1440@NODE_135_length_13154_cov_22_841446_g120_i0_p3_GENE_NODE_135_length_13154_cov_22_841446_g120_i0NODE_135_length_13154_cov_22_841446_g120_i0_p3_ORF_typecomplete_len728_score103_19LCCL/PF03815_19/2_3e13Rxt3/PF08642_10/0_0096POT1PC/PF16686_5/0_31_NODE_135_length_13154_cov_22_841446_g120_i04202603